jgi:hypothetical protein
VYLRLLPDFGDHLFKLVNVDNLHVVMDGTASRGRCGGLQCMTGPVIHVLTLKQGWFTDGSHQLKFIEKRFNFRLKQSARPLSTTKNLMK